MEHIGKFVTYLILVVNALFVGTLILSAYSPYLNPKINPLASSLGLAFPIFLTINLIFIGFWAFVNYRYALLPLAFSFVFRRYGLISLSTPPLKLFRKEASKSYRTM